MKINDAVFGALFLIAAVSVLWSVRGLPTIPGQDVGPAQFPGVLAIVLAVCSIVLIVRGVRERAVQGTITLGEWTRSPARLRNFLLVIALLVFYVLAADTLGFLICASFMLVTLFLSLGVHWATSIAVAAGATLTVHTIFYKMLKVPLPWGVLPVLW